jgi:hypothetical protein
MSAPDLLRRAFDWLATRLAPRDPNAFACGECERWERCGLAPSEQCVTRAAELARRNGPPSAHAAPVHWWGNLGAG